MVRNQFLLRLKPGKLDEYKKVLAENDPGMISLIEAHGIKNISIWNSAEFIFGYFETEEELSFNDEEKEFLDRFEDRMKDVYEYISERGKHMRLMFDAIGEPEESKEFIRKRAFMTKLDLGMQEEYKRRHDLLKANRPAPDPSKPKKKSASNNFTIWNASRYILGYQEINTLLEEPKKPEPEGYINPWETYMLQIMSWISPFNGSMDLLYSRD
ncbi:MAG: L-rhamnose mutarotase [Christensenellaceae bacterium]|jgi:L-rhamnose mutarotase|nr:L-rhamnose mutarotase [Christensenellaceae bacterium]